MLNYRELTENFLETKSEKDFTALYRKVKPGLKSYINKIVKDSEATEDIVGNTLTKMWTKIDQYDPQYQITTWLYRIAFNECLGYINERNKKTSLNKLAEFGIEVGDEGFIGGDISQLIEDSELKTEQEAWDFIAAGQEPARKAAFKELAKSEQDYFDKQGGWSAKAHEKLLRSYAK